MNTTNIKKQHLRTGPPCQHLQADVRVTFLWALKKLPALAMVIAQVLTIQLSTPQKQRTYTVNLNSAKIFRGSFQPLKIVVKTRQRSYNLFFNNGDEADAWESVLLHAASRTFEQSYSHIGPFEDSCNSKLFLARGNQNPNNRFIVKINNHRTESTDTILRSQHERDAHMRLLAPLSSTEESALLENKDEAEQRRARDRKASLGLDKIITLRDFFATPAEDLLVFDYQNGMPLSEAISKYGPLSERNAKIVMYDILKAVDYMHQQGVVHRDIRASNVLYWNRHGNARAKLFDLSDALVIQKTAPGQQLCVDSPADSPGHSPYKAIEVLTDRNHGKPADIWSLGVVLYKMIAGVEPFLGETEVELHHAILASLLTDSLFSPEVWKNISGECKSLVKKMLQPDPLKRVSAIGAIYSRWLDSDLYLVDNGIPAAFRGLEARWEGKRVKQTTAANTTDNTTAGIVGMALPPGSAKAHELRMKWRENAPSFVPLNMSISELISMQRKNQHAEDTLGNDPFLTYEPPVAKKHDVSHGDEVVVVSEGVVKKVNIGRRVRAEKIAVDPEEPVQDSGRTSEEETYPPPAQVAPGTTSQEENKYWVPQIQQPVKTRSLRTAALAVIAMSRIRNFGTVEGTVAPGTRRGKNCVPLENESANLRSETHTSQRRRLRIKIPKKLPNIWSFLKGCFSSTSEAESNRGSTEEEEDFDKTGTEGEGECDNKGSRGGHEDFGNTGTTDGDDDFELQMAMAMAISAS